MKFPLRISLYLVLVSLSCSLPADEVLSGPSLEIIPFGSGGQLKMIYDRRQRPQALFANDQVHMVYNGGSHLEGGDGRKTFPFVISYDLKKGVLGKEIRLGDKPSGDQHYCPVIWADGDGLLHILYGCHRTPGTHLVSGAKLSIGTTSRDWMEGAEICESMSYPTVYHIYDDRQLVYFRTGEHRSSWTYLISSDNGTTWSGPPDPVTDLNRGDELNTNKDPMDMDEMSSYQTVLPSRDGRFLHVIFCSYDDNKKNLPMKFDNPRYGTRENFSFKYNLYYVKVDLRTHELTNFNGDPVLRPVDHGTALSQCLIYDTDWRGAGVPPDIILDENGHPAVLHVLSGDTPFEYNYHYIRYEDGEWKDTVVAPSSDDWNSCYLRRDPDGKLFACLVMGEPFFMDGWEEGSSSMDSRGGGDIEEWISTDKGKTWKKYRNLSPGSPEFSGWKFNNIQPVRDARGSVVDGLYVYYGWNHPEKRTAKAFLVVDADNLKLP